MNKFNHNCVFSAPSLPRILPILQQVKNAYLLWYSYYQILPKIHRYSLGQKVDTFFTEIIEALATASFLKPEEKLPYINLAIRKLDTLKIFLMILWETKSLDEKKYIALSEKLEEIGRMLGGWRGQLKKASLIKASPSKQNSSNIRSEEK